MVKGLDPIHLLLCSDYIIDFNSFLAGMGAGYSGQMLPAWKVSYYINLQSKTRSKELFKLRSAADGFCQDRVVFEIGI